jgi:neutral ceramidase
MSFEFILYVIIKSMKSVLILRKIKNCYAPLRLFSGIFILLFSVPCYAQQPVFRAGASTANISPSLGEGIAGGWMPLPQATHIHDELHARSLVLDDGKVRLVIMVVDNVELPREVFDAAKRLITEETSIHKERIMMSSTHTHSSTWAGHEINPPEPSMSIRSSSGVEYPKPLDDYQRFVVRRMADGVRVALNNLEPARIGWGAGSVPQHVFNRRWKLKSPVNNPFGVSEKVQMNPGIANPNLLEPAGPTDPEVSFISVQSLKGKPIAVLANYSLHYVGGVPKGHISADYFAVFADRLQELLKADRQDSPFVGIMSNGTEGDTNNIDFRGPPVSYPPYAKMKLVANDVAQEVFRVYQTIEHKNWVALGAAQTELTLDVRRPDAQALDWAERAMQKAKPDHSMERVFAERTIQMKEWPEKIDVILQTFRVGDLGIAGIPFEVFAETGLEIKAKSPFTKSFTIGLANGGYGYLPTPEQHQMGGYETWMSVNKVEKEASRKIVTEILKLFKQTGN